MAEPPGPRAATENGSPSAGGGWWWIALLAPLVVSIGVLFVLGPDVVFRSTIPSRTDLPGHLLPPHVLAEHFLPSGRLRGWSPEWFAGFPLYWFYFPLPGWMIAVLGRVVGPEVALRTVTLLPAFGLPWALHLFGRWSRLGIVSTAGGVLVGGSFLLTTSFHLLGGNLLSILSGELAYAWALIFVVLYFGALSRSSGGWSAGLFAGTLLAAAILSHVVPAIVATAATMPLLASPADRRPVLASWAVAGLLTAFWTIPLALNLDQVASLGWSFRPGLSDLVPLEMAFVLPAAVTALPLVGRRKGIALLLFAGVGAILLTWIPQNLVMPGRALPVWFLAVHMLAGVGLGHTLGSFARQRHRKALAIVGCTGGLWLAVMGLRGVEPVHAFSKDVLAGVPARPGADELEALMSRLGELPPGRVHWEDGDLLDRWGGPHVLALIPFWTGHPILGGLLAESSPMATTVRSVDQVLSHDPRSWEYRPTKELAEWDPLRAARILRGLGVRYLITISAPTARAVSADPEAVPMGRFGAMSLFDLGEVAMVSALPCPASLIRVPDRDEARARWSAEVGRSSEKTADWIFAGSRDLFSEPCTKDAGAVDDLVVERERITFRTRAVGVPHLVRISYFPSWRAQNAAGPYVAAPWFMIVVPRAEVVTLEFRPRTYEWAGALLSIVTCGFLLLLVSRRTYRAIRRGRPSPEGPPSALPEGS